ncbi:PIN domain-containing protein [uncultured Tessaracoccus sp.]|uniref:PIN domain-containing protein n=1 Tax=uncultured Tessaracoccus sp. TaxID=905023 RepID=UPI00260D2F4A|nr:PIN domain-containing protein [uncultured Tessaracoccus sp.]
MLKYAVNTGPLTTQTLLAGLLAESGTAGNLTNDAHLATLALELDATMVTFDRDFARFGVRVLVPEHE